MEPRAGRRCGLRHAAAAALCALAAGASAEPAPAADEGPLPVTAVADGVYLHQGVHEESGPGNLGAIANIGFVVGRDAVAVIDTGGSAAVGRRLRAAIAAATQLPVRYVINTHVHPDHILGNAAFRADSPEFVGHAALPDAMARRGPHYLEAARRDLGDGAAGTGLVAPTATVADRRDIDLGGRVLTLQAWPTAHTDNDLTVFDAATGTLWAGDLLFIERVPAVDGSAKGWLAVLDRLAAVPAARVIPGHGPVATDWPGALAGLRRYLTTLLDDVRALQRRHATIEQAMDQAGRAEAGRWQLFDAYHRRNVAATFTELEWE